MLIDIFQEQASLLALIQKIQMKGRLGHAYLLVGEDNEVKDAVSSWWSRLLLCSQPVKNNDSALPCGFCKSCKMMEAGSHPDFTSVKPDGHTLKIEAVRELQRSISLMPMQGARQVCLVHETEKMTTDAANAFLKTLEEPPDHVILLLTASSISDIMPTILSRCQILKCARFSKTRLSELISTYLHEPKMRSASLSMEQLQLIAGLSDGSFTLAKEMLSLDFFNLRDRIFSAITAPERMAISGIFSLSSDLKESQEKIFLSLRILRSIAKDMLLVQAGSDKAFLLNSDQNLAIAWLADHFSQDFLHEYMGLLDQVESAVKRNINRELIAERMMFFWLLHKK